jgi:Family of unknown function (DUF6090)
MLPKIINRKIGDYIIEFCIVLLGITIAFWLSNLGDQAKERRLEAVYLQQLNQDINDDINGLKRAISFNDSKIADLSNGVNYIFANSKKLSADSVATYAMACGEYNFFYPTSNSYITLQQSGDLKIIRDQELKKKLIALYQSYDLIKNEQGNLIQALDENFFPQLHESFNMITGELTSSSFFTSVKCTNFIAFTAQTTGQINRLYQYSSKLASQTSAMILKDLGESNPVQDGPD